MGKFITPPTRPNKPTRPKPDRGFIQEPMADYAEYKSTSYNVKGPFVNKGPTAPGRKRPWTKMVKKGY